MGAAASAAGKGLKAELANKPLEPDDKPRKTKVTATLGPASWTEEMVPEMEDLELTLDGQLISNDVEFAWEGSQSPLELHLFNFDSGTVWWDDFVITLA